MSLLGLGLVLWLAAASSLPGAETGRRYAPTIEVGGVVNAASFKSAPDNFLVANGIISIFGVDLSLGTATAATAGAGRLPTSLGSVTVSIANQPAPLYFVSPGQINAQAPTALPAGQAEILINREGLLSNRVWVKVREEDPGLFMFVGRPVATHLDYTLVGRGEVEGSTPACPGEFVVLFGTGMGQTNPSFFQGVLPPVGAPLVKPVQVLLRGQPLSEEFVPYAGQAPGLAGVYQVNILLPLDLAPGEAEVIVEIDGARSQAGMTLAIDPLAGP